MIGEKPSRVPIARAIGGIIDRERFFPALARTINL
jgi:hypothetical protein